MKRRSLLLTVVALLVLSNLGTFLIATGRVPFIYARGALPEDSPEYEAFLQTLGHIQTRFINEERAADDAVLLRGATEGLVNALEDPYSFYMSPEDYRRFIQSSVGGQYAGVGIVITAHEGNISVIAPIKDTPAYRAGILPMDRIVAVDGESVIGWTSQEASEVIRGETGTGVTLTIRREGVAQPFDVTIVRELIQLTTVESKLLEPDIGYIQVTAFREDTAEACRAAVADLRGRGVKALIVDLRDNPGGLLAQAVATADIFVPPGPVVSTVYRDGRREDLNATQPGLDLPLIVLINGASASGAEIMAGAIQDREAGQLLGVKSFGKATVQNLFNLSGGGGLKLTTARYLTPNGRDINRGPDGAGGIEPDIVLANHKPPAGQRVRLDDPGDERNLQLQRAIELVRERIAAP